MHYQIRHTWCRFRHVWCVMCVMWSFMWGVWCNIWYVWSIIPYVAYACMIPGLAGHAQGGAEYQAVGEGSVPLPKLQGDQRPMEHLNLALCISLCAGNIFLHVSCIMHYGRILAGACIWLWWNEWSPLGQGSSKNIGFMLQHLFKQHPGEASKMKALSVQEAGSCILPCITHYTSYMINQMPAAMHSWHASCISHV